MVGHNIELIEHRHHVAYSPKACPEMIIPSLVLIRFPMADGDMASTGHSSYPITYKDDNYTWHGPRRVSYRS